MTTSDGVVADGVADTSPLGHIAGLFERQDINNQVEMFTHHQTWVQRVLAISSSTASIVLCLTAFYFFFAIDPRRLVFRHQLIFFLLFFDLLKAVILLLYPSRVLTNYTAYYNTNFCHVVGFFTAISIEGADIAILSFAIHTYLLIFKPNLNVRVGNSRRVEGGMYSYRYIVYALSFLIPIVLASLAFIDDQGYHSFVTWCYLPQNPLWYRFVLSWGPRFVILLVILASYALIYFHVIKEFRILGGIFSTFHKKPRRPIDLTNYRPSFFSALTFFLTAVRDYLIPDCVLPESQKSNQDHELQATKSRSSNIGPKQSVLPGHGEENNTTFHHSRNNSRQSNSLLDSDFRSSDEEENEEEEEEDNDDEAVVDGEVDELDEFERTSQNYPTRPEPSHQRNTPGPSPFLGEPPSTGGVTGLGQTAIQQENLKQFRKKQRVIKKQMKSIFIYPMAYIFIWLFPFILYVTQLSYERSKGPIYWINCLASFMQPFYGFVDSLVFFYREAPWRFTVMNKFARDHADRMDTVLQQTYGNNQSFGSSDRPPSSNGPSPLKRRSQSYYSAFSGDGNNNNNNNADHHNSLSANFGVDIHRFKPWRRFLDRLNLPLFQLPTEHNLIKLQQKYVHKRLQQQQDVSEDKNQGYSQNGEKSDGDEKLNPDNHDYSNVLGGNLIEDEFRSTLENFSLNFSKNNSNSKNMKPNSPPRKSSVASNTNRSFRSRQFSVVDPNEMVIEEDKPYGTNDNKPSTNDNKSGTTSPSNQKMRRSSIQNHSPQSQSLQASRIRRHSGSTSSNKLSKGTIDGAVASDNDNEMDFLEFLRKGP